MMRRPFFVGLTTILAILASVIAVFLYADPDTHPPHAARPTADAPGPLPSAIYGATHPGEVITAVAAWVEGELRGEAERQAAEETARLEAARQAANQPMARPGASAPAYEGVGDCTGFAIPDHIIRRESGGNPWAVNPSSGAFGCAQVMPFHWAPGGGCADLDQWTIDGQRECVDRLSQGGTRLSPWNF